MAGMALARQLAAFIVGTAEERLEPSTVEALKLRILDAIGCALGALDAPPIVALRTLVDDLGGCPLATLTGGGRTAPDRAALYNGALVRYLDFNDSYLAQGETCHPSDNLAPVLAAAEYAGRNGRDLLVSLAVAYQVQCRLSDVAPVRDRGFDHVTQGVYAVAAGVARALRFDVEHTTHALAIAGTAYNALRVTRTGTLSNWKGLAYPNAAAGALHAALLAGRGITGPVAVFEGNKGFMEAIAGHFEIDWAKEGLDRIERTILKRYNAEIHSQSALEAILELRATHDIRPEEIERTEIEIFDVAYKIIGGGEEGDKLVVRSKEEADHSLPYLAAVALIDGEVTPAQFAPERILAPDVQALLRRVIVRPSEELSRLFPQHHACRVTIHLRSDVVVAQDKRDYLGFFTRPMSWDNVVAKFERLAAGATDARLRRSIVESVMHLEDTTAAGLAQLLATARRRHTHSGGHHGGR